MRIVRHMQRVGRRLVPRAVILLYHRVAEVTMDPQLLCVTPIHFAQHLDHLRQHYNPISLQELGSALISGGIVPRSVVITFDDGYVDNLNQAKPLLESRGIPATVFVTSGKIDDEREFWWDELEQFLLLPESFPSRLQLTILGRAHFWTLGDGLARREVYDDLHLLLKPLPVRECEAVLKQLAAWSDLGRTNRPGYRAMTAAEVQQLVEGNLIEVGPHTVSHPVLPNISADDQWYEIVESKRQLEHLLGRPVVSFSYPFGTVSDADRQTVELTRQAGFSIACANVHGPVTLWANPYWLPRCIVRDWDGNRFAEELRSFFRS